MAEKENEKMIFRLTPPNTRRHLFLVLDVETANQVLDALVYDIGLAIVDSYGNVYAQYSLVVADIFEDEADTE